MKNRQLITIFTITIIFLAGSVTLGHSINNTAKLRETGSDEEKWPEMKLWYRHPANLWTEALPIGNGRLGAMVFGRTYEEGLRQSQYTAEEIRDSLYIKRKHLSTSGC